MGDWGWCLVAFGGGLRLGGLGSRGSLSWEVLGAARNSELGLGPVAGVLGPGSGGIWGVWGAWRNRCGTWVILRGSGIWELQARACLWVVRGLGAMGAWGFRAGESELQGFGRLGLRGLGWPGLLSPCSCPEPGGFHESRLFPQAVSPRHCQGLWWSPERGSQGCQGRRFRDSVGNKCKEIK